ncbi:hypothetical protein BASA50_007088 [Batrachochytrium salamandrivorans]|uniref:RING-type domain-containing protein n=1 Tax=Batrachochytrium salamandrivorans TaxID=1357716 RepID=A0ABQ8F9B6_9FUNG|nr:hypothetical protein BASA50_007088 [Batrachochytrium salamandrivorans]KAH9272296.1 hypothetical protein BASA83_005389 [Batrachochytrium salamandrivorans]
MADYYLQMRTISESVQQPTLLRILVSVPSAQFVEALTANTSYFHTWQFGSAMVLAATFLAVRLLRSVVLVRPWPHWAMVAARAVLLVWILGLGVNIILNVGSLVNSGGGLWTVLSTRLRPDAPAIEEAMPSTALGTSTLTSSSLSHPYSSYSTKSFAGASASASAAAAPSPTSDLDLDDSPVWARTLADSFFLDIIVYEAIVRCYILLYPRLDGQAPRYHHGSLDGDFLWAAVLYMHYAVDLLPLMLLKWLQMASLLSHLAANMAVDNPRWELILAAAPRAVHWVRLLHLVWSIVLGHGAPWLLWVPNLMVLGAAVLFNFGVGAGMALSTRAAEVELHALAQSSNGLSNLNRDEHSRVHHGEPHASGSRYGVFGSAGARAMQQPSFVKATSPTMSISQHNDLTLQSARADALYQQFLDFDSPLEGIDSEDYEDQLWESDRMGEECPSCDGLSNSSRGESGDGRDSDNGGDGDEMQTDTSSNDISTNEINELLSDAYAGSNPTEVCDAMDESYLCPGRVFTRQMRYAVLHNQPNERRRGRGDAAASLSHRALGVRRRSSSGETHTVSYRTLWSRDSSSSRDDSDMGLRRAGSTPPSVLHTFSSPFFPSKSQIASSSSSSSASIVPSPTTAGARQIMSGAASAMRGVAARADRFHRVLASHAPVARMVDRIILSRQRENQRRNDIGLKCVVCTTRIRDIILQPCNHLCICEDCKTTMGQQNIGRCPVCSKEVAGTVKIFWS